VISLTPLEVALLVEAIENLDIYVSDDDTFEMIENSTDDFESKLETLYEKMKGELL
jgi:hypothetical protein